jgi:predicted dehydrogenase
LRNNPTGEWNYSISPGAESIDWKAYVGQAKNVPAKFDPEHFFRWRKFYPYCSGLLGDLVPHRLHPLMLATGSPEFPKRVVCIGTHSIHSDKAGGAYERDVPEYVQLEAEFPSGFLLSINSSSVSGKVPGFSIFGQDATLDVTDSGNALEMNPERHKADELDAISIKGLQHEDQVAHAKNWLDCIRTGKTPNGNIDLAIKCQTVISLAEMSDRLGIVCFFDEKTRTVKDGSGKEVKLISYGTVEKS